MRTILRNVTAAALSGLALCAVATGASAAGAEQQPSATGASMQAPPPPCVTARLGPWGYVSRTVHIENACAVTQRVKVLVAYGPDSECLIIASRTDYDWKMYGDSEYTRFDGLEAC